MPCCSGRPSVFDPADAHGPVVRSVPKPAYRSIVPLTLSRNRIGAASINSDANRLSSSWRPFSDARRRKDEALGVEAVNLDQRPGMDESTFLVGLLTAICRPSLWLAPGFLLRAPEIQVQAPGRACWYARSA